jgi:hypothetical protein
LWAYDGLSRLGVAPLELVLVEDLFHATRWEHRLDADGTHLNFTMADGRRIDASRVRGAINRVLAPAPMSSQGTADADYIQAELYAFYLSWLKGLGGLVVNRATATGLCGPWLHASQWTLCAGRSGLQTRRYRQGAALHSPSSAARTTDGGLRRVVTFQGELFGSEVPASVAQGCARLADAADIAMLGIDFEVDASGRWLFADATPCPDLTVGGLPLLRALAQTMQEVRI